MKCPRCQHENEAGARFCEECAAPLVRACASLAHRQKERGSEAWILRLLGEIAAHPELVGPGEGLAVVLPG